MANAVGNSVNDDLKKEFIMKGLKKNIVEQVRIADPADLNELFTEARKMERIKREISQENWNEELNQKGREQVIKEYTTPTKNIFAKDKEQINKDLDDITSSQCC